MGFANQQKMMKQMQKMQANIAKVQEELGEMTVEVTAGGGAVRCVMSCDVEVKALEIDPELLNPEEIDMLQDLLIVVFNEASRQASEKANAEMAKATGNIRIPGLS